MPLFCRGLLTLPLQPLSKAKWNIYIIIMIRNAFNELSIDRERREYHRAWGDTKGKTVLEVTRGEIITWWRNLMRKDVEGKIGGGF